MTSNNGFFSENPDAAAGTNPNAPGYFSDAQQDDNTNRVDPTSFASQNSDDNARASGFFSEDGEPVAPANPSPAPAPPTPGTATSDVYVVSGAINDARNLVLNRNDGASVTVDFDSVFNTTDITNVSFDNTNRVLTITTAGGLFTAQIPETDIPDIPTLNETEFVSVTLASPNLVFTRENGQTASVSLQPIVDMITPDTNTHLSGGTLNSNNELVLSLNNNTTVTVDLSPLIPSVTLAGLVSGTPGANNIIRYINGTPTWAAENSSNAVVSGTIVDNSAGIPTTLRLTRETGTVDISLQEITDWVTQSEVDSQVTVSSLALADNILTLTQTNGSSVNVDLSVFNQALSLVTDNTLTGDGSAANPLSVSFPDTTNSISFNDVNNVLTSTVNGITSTTTIPDELTRVSTDSTLTGDGSATDPLSVVPPTVRATFDDSIDRLTVDVDGVTSEVTIPISSGGGSGTM